MNAKDFFSVTSSFWPAAAPNKTLSFFAAAVLLFSCSPTLRLPSSFGKASSTLSLLNSYIQSSESVVTAGTTTTITFHAISETNASLGGGLNVTFNSSLPGTFSATIDHGNGLYTATFTPIQSGTTTITATLLGETLASSGLPLSVIPSAPTSIAISNGNNQTGTIAGVLPTSLVALVKDAQGNVEFNSQVDWSVTFGAGSPSLSSPSSDTDVNGLASIQLTLGSVPGGEQVTATVHGTAINQVFNEMAIDSTPTVSISSPAASSYINNAGKTNFTLSGTCSANGQSVVLSGAASGTATCTGNTWTKTFDLSTISDGSISFTANLTDAFGGTATANTRTFLKDTVVTPFSGISITPTSPGNSVTPTVSGQTEGSASLQLFNAAACSGTVIATATANSSGALSLTPGSSIGADGTYTLSILSTDLAGNTLCSSPLTYILDTTPPVLTLTNSSILNNANSATFGGACETGLSVVITGSATTSVACTGSTWTYSPSQSSNGTYTYQFTQTDAAGNSTQVTGTWTRFLGTPLITSLSFTSGHTTFATPNVLISLTASNSGGPAITLYRASDDNTFAHANWTSLGTGVSLGTVVSFTNGTRPMYVEIEDAAGNVSAINNSLNFTMAYGQPPVITNFTVINSASPNTPINYNDLAFSSSNQTMYISWVASAPNGLQTSPYSLYYSTDLSTWTPISPLTPSNPFFGSVTLGSIPASGNTTSYGFPTGGGTVTYIRLGVTDQYGQTTYSTAPALNIPHWTLVGGSIDYGVGGSAAAARPRGGQADFGQQSLAFDSSTSRIYFFDGGLGTFTYIDPVTAQWQSIGPNFYTTWPVVADEGLSVAIDSSKHTLYFNCAGLSQIYKMDLTTGVVSNFLAKIDSGSMCGIAVDSLSNVYTCVDSSHIVKVAVDGSGNAGTPVIIAGNGTNGTVTTANDAKTSALPNLDTNKMQIAISNNGEVYFTTVYTDNNLWRIRNSDGHLINPLTFTSAHGTNITQGRSGDEIIATQDNNYVNAVDGVTATVTTLAGNGSVGYSSDGTAATSASLLINGDGAVVNSSGQVFFVDGTGDGARDAFIRLRTFDSNNHLQTILGSIAFTGDGGTLAQLRVPAGITAQLNQNDGKVYLTDGFFMKTWTPSSDLISPFLGNGTFGIPTTGATSNTPIFFPDAIQFLGSGLLDIFHFTGANFNWNGSTYTAIYPAGYHAVSTGAPLSDCDGKNVLTNCLLGGDTMVSDGAGNGYTLDYGAAARILKVDSNGNVSQLMGSNVVAFSPDCNTVGCAKTLSMNNGTYLRYVGYDNPTSSVIYADIDGTNNLFRAVSVTNDTLTTLGSFSNSTASFNTWGYFYDGAKYFYWNEGYGANYINRIDVTNGILSTINVPSPFDAGLSIFNTSSGGQPYFMDRGAIYRYDP